MTHYLTLQQSISPLARAFKLVTNLVQLGILPTVAAVAAAALSCLMPQLPGKATILLLPLWGRSLQLHAVSSNARGLPLRPQGRCGWVLPSSGSSTAEDCAAKPVSEPQ